MSPPRIEKTEQQWREVLSDREYQVTRCSGTEPPFTGEFWDHHADGRYTCKCCGVALFDSQSKFDSGSGWPSYVEPVNADVVEELLDKSHGMIRVEVRCHQCSAHLGHVFEDGPQPTGRRYCINSAALNFKPRD